MSVEQIGMEFGNLAGSGVIAATMAYMLRVFIPKMQDQFADALEAEREARNQSLDKSMETISQLSSVIERHDEMARTTFSQLLAREIPPMNGSKEEAA